MTSQLCGTEFADLVGAASPFARIIAFGYHDGPTTGVVRCDACPEAYRFVLLASDVDGHYDRASWDRGEELRIFALTPLPTDAWDRIVGAMSSVEEPRWPVWVPGMRGRSPHLDRLLEADVAPILAGGAGPHLIVAAGGLLQPIVAVRDYPTESGDASPDWFALLGFAADERLVASR